MMVGAKTGEAPRVTQVIERYGKCLELVALDPHFHEITVGVYVKDDISTVWTFSQKPGAEQRIEKIRDRLVGIGGLAPVEGTHNQAIFSCGYFHTRPMKFLLTYAVEKDPDSSPPEGAISVKDTKSKLILGAQAKEVEGRWIYEVTGEGEAPNTPMRLKAIVRGFIRYAEMEKVSDTEVTFPCGARHDGLVRLLIPFARNVSAVEDMMESADMRGQLTTGTAGFSPL